MMRHFLLIWLLLMSTAVSAHKPSDSYLLINSNEQQIQGQWDIALRDLNYAIGLDDNSDGQITWGELQHHHDNIAAYALARLSISTDNNSCSNHVTEQLVDNHSDGAYSVLRFQVSCPSPVRMLKVHYQLFFDFDLSHRGLLRMIQNGSTQTAVFSPEHRQRTFELATVSMWQEFIDFAREGIWHIWVGYDHILFLLSLLLPAVVVRKDKSWQAVEQFRPAFVEVLKIVTAFTVAHSITLSLAALSIINLPSRWVESAIAASVVIAAFNNLYPVIQKRLWICAFAFGLVHGLGFASVLTDLGLPKASLVTALVAFNVGVEIGQFAIISLFLPLAFILRGSWFYRRLTLGFGSVLIATVAMFWLLDRSLALGLLA